MNKKITEIADVQLGYQFRKKIEPDVSGGNRVIQIRDFDENHLLNKENLLRVSIDKLTEQYVIRRGDILFLSRGQRNWAAAINDDLPDTVAVSHFFVVRPKRRDVLSEYLAWYINQVPAQEFLHNIARRGTHMPLVPLSAFTGLTIALPDIETQKRIVELSRLVEKERQLLSSLQEKRSQLINTISLQAATGKRRR